tara:strand:+ start:692 stop:1744 length:1053 start_codon:yes stop_codon:yes gene_type:complete
MKISHTKAAILLKQKHPLVIDNIELPNDLLPGQVLVKVLVSGICGSQLGEIDGVKGEDKFLPHLMGHEGCAYVIEIGPGVRTLKVGDKIILHWRKGSGMQSDPPKYKWKGNVLNAGWVTTFNQYAVVSENRCTRVNDEVPSDVAALFGCAVTTGFGVVENNANLKIGESVVVFGAGGIGLNIIQAAAMVSGNPIIAVDIHNNRLNLAKSLGATHIINNSSNQAFEIINKILGKNNVDVFIDNTGNTKIIELGYSIIKNDGRLVLVGVPKFNQNISIFTLPIHFGKQIIGSFGGECQPEKDIPRYLKLVNCGFLNLEPIISQRFSLDEINHAISLVRDGSVAGRVMIDLNK